MRYLVSLVVSVLALATTWDASELHEREHRWVLVATPVVCLIVAWALPRLRTSIRQPGVVGMALASSMAAVYGCVPETDQIPPVALAVGIVLLIELVTWRALPASWFAGAGSLVLVAGLYGATGRQSALIGALFAAWAFVILPFVELIRPSVRDAPEPIRWIVAGIGSIGAIVVARTGALEPSAAPAVAAAAIAVVVTTAVSVSIALAWSRLR
jgi:hypothetical protein